MDNISRYLTVSSQRFAWRIGRFSNEMQKRGHAGSQPVTSCKMKTPDCLISRPTSSKIASSRFHLEPNSLVSHLSTVPELPIPSKSSKLGLVLDYRGFQIPSTRHRGSPIIPDQGIMKRKSQSRQERRNDSISEPEYPRLTAVDGRDLYPLR